MPWKYGELNRALAARSIRRQTATARCDAVITTADETFDGGVPTFAYQDMNFAVAYASSSQLGSRMVNTLPTTRDRLRQLAEWQSAQYERLAGVFAMSRWFRDELIDQELSAASVHVVGAGLTSAFGALRSPRETADRTRLLFIGADFERKAGDQVLSALELLRREGDRRLSLTIVGPRRWPYPDDPPSWVRFLGSLPPDRVGPLFPKHDLFVMPSRFEPYGIVLLEAQAAAVPCIARRAFAMPELVPEGRGGLLVEQHGGPQEIAEKIDAALRDDVLHEAVIERATEVREIHSWDAVAARIVAAVDEAVAA